MKLPINKTVNPIETRLKYLSINDFILVPNLRIK